jgi:hypothetical protein
MIKKNLRNEKTCDRQKEFVNRISYSASIFLPCVCRHYGRYILAIWFLKSSHNVLALWQLVAPPNGACRCHGRSCYSSNFAVTWSTTRPASTEIQLTGAAFHEQHARRLLGARGTNALGMEIGVEYWIWG